MITENKFNFTLESVESIVSQIVTYNPRWAGRIYYVNFVSRYMWTM